MDKRTFLALALTALVIVLTPLLFPRQPTDVTGADSTAAAGASTAPRTDSGARGVASASTNAAQAGPAPAPLAVSPTAGVQRPLAAQAETISVPRAKSVFQFVTPGAVPAAVRLTDYRTLRPGTTGGMVIATPAVPGVPVRAPLLGYRLVTGADTIALDSVPFHAATTSDGVTFTSAGSPQITIAYASTADPYVTHVSGTVAGATQLLVALPEGLRSEEADTTDDLRHLAIGYKPVREDVRSIPFGKLDSTLVRTDSGPFTWVSTRNKYFLVALVASPASSAANAFVALRMQGGHNVQKITTSAHATAVLPVRNGSFAYDLYVGPQSWEQMRAVGHELENVNPYAGWLHGVVQPFATIVMRVLLWMKRTLQVNYGWVLIIFGIAVRLLLWPLNQSAMRSSIKMQRLQPELQEVQKRYKNDPEKQREAMMRLYQEHGMSPFSPVMGCLPMLLPMPVLFALYFVFQNTIEFRGVSFLWMPDLALHDPLYITPIFMGVSMFVLSWIGMRAAPPNPQAKMMSYMMPAVLTVMFMKFAAGLNLYYAVQNVAALPQQWILARERAKNA